VSGLRPVICEIVCFVYGYVIVWLVQLGMIGHQNEALLRNAYLNTEWFYELILPTSSDRLKPLSL